MTVRKIGRRWMLLGAGGAAIALPSLPSLLTGLSSAKAQADSPRRMVAICSGHGGIWQPQMYPSAADADTPFAHSLHTCHRGGLRSTVQGSERVISAALRAPSDSFSESLVGKMNLIRGMDVPFYVGHGRHNLGSYADMSNNHDNVTADQETADQVLAHSAAMYPETPRRRVINFSRGALSVEMVDRGVGSSAGFQPTEEVGAEAIFNSVYVESGGEPTRPPPIDAVHESYRRLEAGAFGAGGRLGRDDRLRLTQYMDRLSDIRSGLSAPVGAHCGDVVPPASYPWYGSSYGPDTYALYHDVTLAAFMCDSSRVAVFWMDETWVPGADAEGGYHEVVHQSAGNPNDMVPLARVQQFGEMVRTNNEMFFRSAVLDLVNKMDALSEGDGTMLDNSLVWWSHESGAPTHETDSIPIITFGSAGGRMQTGQYLDMRNRDDTREFGAAPSQAERKRGACYFQWTTTYLDAFGVAREEWQVDSRRAFSPMPAQASWELPYDHASMDASCDDPLPILI